MAFLDDSVLCGSDQSVRRALAPLMHLAEKHRCGLLLDRDSVLGGNMANDLTPEVVQGLDRKTTSITFDLEPLPSNAGK